METIEEVLDEFNKITGALGDLVVQKWDIENQERALRQRLVQLKAEQIRINDVQRALEKAKAATPKLPDTLNKETPNEQPLEPKPPAEEETKG